MPSPTTKPKASWRNLAQSWLTKLEISEISLVDKPASKYAIVALAKRDGSGTDTYQRTRQVDGSYLFERIRKQSGAGGPGEAALPVYRESTDPQYQNLTRPNKGGAMIVTNASKKKRKRGKLAGMREAITKSELPSGHQSEVWTALVRKAAIRAAKSGSAGGLRQREEAALGKLLEADYQTGGHIIGYLSSSDPANNGHVVAKAAPARQETNAERILHQRAERICKADPTVTYQAAYSRVLEADPSLYALYEVEHEIQKREMADSIEQKRKGGTAMDDTDDDADDGDDADDDDDDDDDDENDGRTTGKRKAKCSKCAHVAKEDDAEYCPKCGSKLKRATGR